MTLLVGLTGGIGSGKSTVAQYFAQLGAPVIDADVIAKELVVPGAPALSLIKAQLGAQYFQTDGSLNRSLVREAIFKNPALKTQLESILHPLIQQELFNRAQQFSGSYGIVCVPLLVENIQNYEWLDRILVIDLSEPLQIERASARDRLTSESIEATLKAQASRSQRLALADDVVVNDEDLEALQEKVRQLHHFYLSLSQ